MALNPFDNAVKSPFRPVPTGDVTKQWIDNTRGTELLAYGARSPLAAGYESAHDHGRFGGELLGMHLGSYHFGHYRRQRGFTFPGFPICPPVAGLSFAIGRVKLLAAVPLRLPGGVVGVHVDLRLIPELFNPAAQVTIGVVLRPFGMVNFNAFLGSIAESAFNYGHLKKVVVNIGIADVAARARATFGSLTRCGASNSNRWVELCFFLMSNLTSTDVIHLTGAKVLVAAVTNNTAFASTSYPATEEVSPAQLVPGSPLWASLAQKAKQRGNALHRVVIGGEPGYAQGSVSPARRWTQRLKRAHGHTGTELLQADGTTESDGALLPHLLFGQGYPHLDETGGDRYPTSDPCKGIRVSRTGALNAELTHRQRISLGAGAAAVSFVFALRAENNNQTSRLLLSVHLCPVWATPDATNNLIAEVSGEATIDAAGFVVGAVLPENTPGYALGSWSRAAEENAAQMTNGVVPANIWRVSQQVSLSLKSGARATEDYVLRYRFSVFNDPAETTLDTGAALVWAGAAY